METNQPNQNLEAFPKERAAFRSLLLTNPNYFGNLPRSRRQAVFKIITNTFYEELGCVGYHPQQERLEAVVHLKQPSGYGTDVCGFGTTEYVRFYLSFNNGATWEDQGLTSFQAFNTAETGRLEYAVSLAVDPRRRFCFFDPVIKVRAILSWNDAPDPNQPDWTPVWGNVKDASIQVEPFRLILPKLLFEEAKIKLPKPFETILDLNQPLQTKQETLTATDLAVAYKGKDVPAHRFAFQELMAFASAQTSISAEAFEKTLPGIEINPNIFELLFPKTDGNTSYEELTCIGLDPNFPDTLVGIIKVKQSSGFSGGPCTSGSREYVTFWADFDGNGSFESYLGTANVRVYDLPTVPADGVHYAVRIPIDLSRHRQPCLKGPKIVRIRAILSWNTPVDASNPNQVPTWGNREEAQILIAPASSAPVGKIAILGGIPVSQIGVNGLTLPTARFATNNTAPDSLGRPCPFGGRVTVQGAPLTGHSYLVEVTPLGGSVPTPVVTDLMLTRQDGTTYTHTANPITHRFAYQPFTENINGVLAQWDTAGDAAWTVKLSVFDGGGTLVSTDSHVIQLDNTGPQADITITVGAGDCGKFSPGAMLSGTFVARDTYLGSYSLGVEPLIPENPVTAVPSPSSGTVNTSVAGDAWSLNTTGMKSCGYIIRVVATDRAILNSQSVGHTSADSAGFCLL